MKVAVQISGRQRYGKYFGEFQNTLATTFGSVDYFIHNWHDQRMTSDIIKLIQFPHNVKDVQLEPQKPFFVDPKWLHPYGNVFNVISMIYGVQQVNEMRKAYEETSGTKYDLVIRARSDIKVADFPIDPTWIMSQPDNTVFVGIRPHYLPAHLEEVQDQIAIGKPAAMDIYASMYDGIKVPFEPLAKGSKPKFHPETYVCWWLKKHGVVINEDQFSTLLENDHIDRKQRATY